ncbi:type II toxin-antitoxin system VapC family toxin [Treponema sp. R6D11]
MNTILVDTTIWVDFFREKETKQANVLQQLIEEENNICICPIIYQEVLQGVKDENIFTEIKSILKNVTMINTPIMTVVDHAIDLYRSLRKEGITIRKPYDCLIAPPMQYLKIFIFYIMIQISVKWKIKVI